MAKYQYQADNFPVKVTAGVRKLLDEGVLYLAGRDKYYRPITVL